MKDQLEFQRGEDEFRWDADLLENCEYPHPIQSSAYAAYLVHDGFTPNYIYITHGGENVAFCSASIYKRKIARWSYGPTIARGCRIPYNEIFLSFIEYLKQSGVAGIELTTTQVMYGRKGIYDGTAPLESVCETPYVDLSRSEKEIQTAFDRSVRKNVRKCVEAGAEVVFFSDAAALHDYHAMLSAHRAKLGLELPPFYPNKRTMKLFSRPGLDMEIAMARVDGAWIAALGFVSFGKVVTEVAVGQSDKYASFKLAAHDLIKVKAIERYKARGLTYYDLSGVSRDAQDEKEQNIRRFKLKFTSDVAEFAFVRQKALFSAGFLTSRIMRKLTGMLSPRAADVMEN